MSDEPRIRGREDLERYVDHFNNRRYAQQIAYYAPDVLYKVGAITMNTPQAIADFYDDFHEHVRERVEIGWFAMTGDTVAVTIPSRFEAFRPYEKHGLSYLPGKVVEFVSFAFYKLQDGKIRRIRVARFGGTAEDLDA